MKINWRIIVAAVLIVAVGIWMFDSLRVRTYEGGNLNVGIGHGTVTIVNSSDQPVAAQLFSASARSFAVTSSVEGLAGTSTRAGSGSTATQTFLFDAPPGQSTLSVPRAANVNFVTATDDPLEVTIDPQSASEAQTIRIGGIVVIAIAAYFIYRTVRSDQKLALRRAEIAHTAATAVPASPVAVSNTGRDGRAYSDS